MSSMLLYCTCSNRIVTKCYINYWDTPNGTTRVKPLLSLILILSAQTLVWHVWNGSATFTLVQWQNQLWIIKNFAKLSPQPKFNLNPAEVSHILPWQHWARPQELLYYIHQQYTIYQSNHLAIMKSKRLLTCSCQSMEMFETCRSLKPHILKLSDRMIVQH